MGYKRKISEKRRLKKLYEETRNGYGAGAYYDRRKGRIIRYSEIRKSGHPKYLRHRANKKVRRSELTLQKGGYRKLYDYWWNLW